MGNSFKDEDKQKVVEFLNLIAAKAKFSDVSVQDNIRLYGLLSYMQKELLPKIEANILEIVAVHEAEESQESKEE